MTPILGFRLKENTEYKLLKPIRTEGKDFSIGSSVKHARVDLDGDGFDMPSVITINDVPISPGLTLDVEEILPETTKQ